MVQTHPPETATRVQTSWITLAPVLGKAAASLLREIGEVGQWKGTACSPIFSSYAGPVTAEHFTAMEDI